MMGALSNGCNSCKKRKVKCDETRPKCKRCLKAGIDCTGYTTRLRFVDENPRVRRGIRISRTQADKISTITESSPLALETSGLCRSLNPSPAPYGANTLSLTAFKDNIFISYLFHKLFGQASGGYSCTPSQCGMPANWLINTARNPRHKSWDALAALVFGQAHCNNNVKLNALALYGQALLELRERLSNPADRRSDSMVAIMTAFYMYEVRGCTVILRSDTDNCRY